MKCVANSNKASGWKVWGHWNIPFEDTENAVVPIEILFSLPSESETIWYRAHSRDPLFANAFWEGSDLESLKAKVEEDVSRLLRVNHEENWEPVIVVRTRGLSRVSDSCNHIGFDLAISGTMAKQSFGENDRHHIVNSGRNPSVLIEHNSHRNFGKNRTSNMQSARLLDVNHSLILVEANQKNGAALEKIAGALHLFCDELTEVLAPSQDDNQTLPSLKDLSDMMQRATDNVEKLVSLEC